MKKPNTTGSTSQEDVSQQSQPSPQIADKNYAGKEKDIKHRVANCQQKKTRPLDETQPNRNISRG